MAPRSAARAIQTVESDQQSGWTDHRRAADDADLGAAATQLVDDPSSFTGARRHHPRLLAAAVRQLPYHGVRGLTSALFSRSTAADADRRRLRAELRCNRPHCVIITSSLRRPIVSRDDTLMLHSGRTPVYIETDTRNISDFIARFWHASISRNEIAYAVVHAATATNR